MSLHSRLRWRARMPALHRLSGNWVPCFVGGDLGLVFQRKADVVETIRRFHAVGVRHLILDFVGPYEERFIEIERFARDALPLLADLRGQ